MNDEELNAGSLDIDSTLDINSDVSDSDIVTHEDPLNNFRDDGILSDLLYSKGITDPNKIKFEEDSGEVVERSWGDLSKQERLNILSSDLDEDTELNDDEIGLINDLRKSGLSSNEYLNHIIQSNAQQVSQIEEYSIDSISDDELFVLDALDKYGEDNITDEQLDELLEKAKENQELFAKTIDTLRRDYKNREDEYKFREQKALEEKAQQEYQAFSDTVLNEIRSLDNIGGLPVEFSTDDMNDVANFILTQDENGNTEFSKWLNSPAAYVRLAVWALKGNDILHEMTGQLQSAYKAGLEVANRGKSTLAFNDKTKDKTSATHYSSADALDVE